MASALLLPMATLPLTSFTSQKKQPVAIRPSSRILPPASKFFSDIDRLALRRSSGADLVARVTTPRASTAVSIKHDNYPFDIKRDDFPSDFLFGAGSASYQVEGAWNEHGKGLSIWDTFADQPGNVENGDHGKLAVDFYNHFKEDIKLAKSQGLDVFKISISWSRILPEGNKEINMAGIDFYNNVINEILDQGMKPFVGLYHWDLPQALENEYGGFLDHKIIGDFQNYVDICFKHFGDRVKLWITINEPYSFATTGYDFGIAAPGRSSFKPKGNSRTEPYIAGHNMLLAHAAAYDLYRKKYKKEQHGEIGIKINSFWFEPFSKNPLDVKASQRSLDFMLGWFLRPVVYGDYPEDMKRIVGTRLPTFTKAEKDLLKGSYDFIGVNYYTSKYSAHLDAPEGNIWATHDTHVKETYDINEVLIGGKTGSDYHFVVPRGLTKLLIHIKDDYKNPNIYITECGMAENHKKPGDDVLEDPERVAFFKAHFLAAYDAMKHGVKVKGFMLWAFHDNFEWYFGYKHRYGINYIDFNDEKLERKPKRSAQWLKKFLLDEKSGVAL